MIKAEIWDLRYPKVRRIVMVPKLFIHKGVSQFFCRKAFVLQCQKTSLGDALVFLKTCLFVLDCTGMLQNTVRKNYSEEMQNPY